jgi:polysaccharide biosynthesis protein PslJ
MTQYELASARTTLLGGGTVRTMRADTRTREGALGWRRALSALVLLIWLVPIKGYKLPVHLPFNLEPYRLLVIALLLGASVALLTGTVRLSAGGLKRPLILFVLAAAAALITNFQTIQAAGLLTQATKSFSFFLSFLIVFLLFSSLVQDMEGVHYVLRVVVAGAALVALGALYEGRTHYQVFQHLHTVFPFLQHVGTEHVNFRGGRLRVRASAQHPIALGAVMVMTMPLALYLTGCARTKARSMLWFIAAGLLGVAAISTVSRTVVLMMIAMTVVALKVRGRQLLRYWPALLAVVAASHVAAPGAISHLYKAFNPKGGLISQQDTRSAQKGSGRIADLGPGLRLWSASPLFGRALGTQGTTGDSAALVGSEASGAAIIFDDQYMNTLVTLGVVGLVALIWFVWGSVVKLARAARARAGPAGDLLAACAIACAGFGGGMLTYDAFAFVQVTLIFFIVAALGLRARSLVDA